MIRCLLSCLVIALSGVAVADTVVPVRTIRAHAIIGESDLVVKSGSVSGAFDQLGYVIGQEARTTLYAGRPIRFDDIGPPALVSRNQIVPLRFETPGLVIMTEGRSLERGSLGDRVRVMNLDSRTTLFGKVREDGSVEVMK